MKFINKYSVGGFLVGVGVATGVAILITIDKSRVGPATDAVYLSYRIEGNNLKTLYDADFSQFYLEFEERGSSPSQVGFKLIIFDRGLRRYPSVPTGLIRPTGSETPISGTRILIGDRYKLEHNSRPTRFNQLMKLAGIMRRNPNGYLILHPGPYSDIDPTDTRHIYYKITPHMANGDPITGLDASEQLALDYNPCPPARPH